VDSSRTGKAEEEMMERLFKVEQSDEPTEIVIHVNMLKEGWDVSNLYTIVPLRAANARILIEQSIGRGLPLPFGKRTGVTAVDRLNIVAHDKFQEIIDEANRPDSAIRLQAVVLDEADLDRKTATLVSRPKLEEKLGITPSQLTPNTHLTGKDEPPLFDKPAERKVAQMAWEEIRKRTHQPQKLPSVAHLKKPEVQAAIVVQKFDSEAERKLAAILERDALKWFKPAKGQFQIIYRHGADHLEYISDFVAETADTVFMIEPKAGNRMEDPVVLAKKEAAVKWCAYASDHAQSHGGKPWCYVLIPHNEIAVNITLDALAARFSA
jgi:hypothetical protein